MLISKGCPWASMKRGGCKFGGSKTGAVHGQKGGAVVSQLVPKLQEPVPPPPRDYHVLQLSLIYEWKNCTRFGINNKFVFFSIISMISRLSTRGQGPGVGEGESE